MTKINKIVIFILSVVIVAGFIAYFYITRDTFAEKFLLRYEETRHEVISQHSGNAQVVEGAAEVPIVVYHSVAPYYPSESTYKKKFDVEPNILEEHLRYLKENHYTGISLDDLADHFFQNASLPPKAIILTFDDGWENQYKYAFPLLKKYNYTATFFIFTNAIGHKKFLTWPQIKELIVAGMAIGDHTESHPYLFKITAQDALRKEIVGSKEILEKNLGKRIDVFAYPFGHYNDEIIHVLKENGFRAARTDGYKGIFHTANDIFTLKSLDAQNSLVKFIEALNTKK